MGYRKLATRQRKKSRLRENSGLKGYWLLGVEWLLVIGYWLLRLMFIGYGLLIIEVNVY